MTLPFVSILIPAKNEELHIEKCLSSLLKQSYPRDRYEIIVADNQSSDKTKEIAEKLSDLTFSTGENRIGKIRNQLVNRSRGDFLAFIDADCTAHEDWLAETITYFSEHSDLEIIGGYIRAPEKSPVLVRGWAPPKKETIKTSNIAATGSLFTRRKTFLKINGFNETVLAGEDTEYCGKVKELGGKIILHPSASVIHYGFPSSVSGFLRRQYWQSSNYLETRKKGGDITFYATLFFLIILATIGICALTSYFRVSLFFIAVLVTGISTIALLKTLKTKGNRFMYFVPIFITTALYFLARTAGLGRSIYFTAQLKLNRKDF